MIPAIRLIADLNSGRQPKLLNWQKARKALHSTAVNETRGSVVGVIT
jgi:hypothetical protein